MYFLGYQSLNSLHFFKDLNMDLKHQKNQNSFILFCCESCPVHCLMFFFSFFLSFCPTVACGIVVPWPGIGPVSSAMKGRVLTAGPPGKPPVSFLLSSLSHFSISLPYCFSSLQGLRYGGCYTAKLICNYKNVTLEVIQRLLANCKHFYKDTIHHDVIFLSLLERDSTFYISAHLRMNKIHFSNHGLDDKRKINSLYQHTN